MFKSINLAETVQRERVISQRGFYIKFNKAGSKKSLFFYLKMGGKRL